MPSKLFATVNDREIELMKCANGKWTVIGGVEPSMVTSGPYVFSVLLNGRSHKALLLSEDGGVWRIRVGKSTYTVALQDEDTRRVKALGLDLGAEVVQKKINAPMPGLVLKLMVEPGQSVKKGDGMLILEAMKMENMIKAPGDGVIKNIAAQQGKAVEKGQLLIELE